MSTDRVATLRHNAGLCLVSSVVCTHRTGWLLLLPLLYVIAHTQTINGTRYSPLGCVAKVGGGDPEPGCIGLVARQLTRQRDDAEFTAGTRGFRDPASTLQMVWTLQAGLLNTEALGSVLWARNVLMEADDVELQWREWLRRLDEDCETPSDICLLYTSPSPRDRG